MRRLFKNLLGDKSAADAEPAAPASFDDVLIRELGDPTVIDLDAATGQTHDEADGFDERVDVTTTENRLLRAELIPAGEPGPHEAMGPSEAEAPIAQHHEPADFRQTDFWDRYDEAAAAADLFAVPPAAVTAVIGPLEVAIGIAKRCQADHWAGSCDVFVLTERADVPGEPTWTTLGRPSDVVAILEEGRSDFPLIVLDIQRELPAWVRPLVVRLRESGLGLVHYVLDDDPNDEDLATWHGELGRPSVLDLAAHLEPDRVLELLDRGEPIASVAGQPISTDLLLALRLGAL